MPVPKCDRCGTEVADPSNYEESWNNVGVQGEDGVYCSPKCRRIEESDDHCDNCGSELKSESVSFEDNNYCSVDCMTDAEDEFDLNQYFIVYKVESWTIDRAGASSHVNEKKGRFEGEDLEDALTELMKQEHEENQDPGGVVEICEIENIVKSGDEI